MNITYLIGVLGSFVVMVLGIVITTDPFGFNFGQIGNFIDGPSIFIVIGCSLFIVVASVPVKTLVSMPKHFAIMLNTKKYNPSAVIEQLVDLAQIARKNGLLALEEQARAQTDPFFRQGIMLIVDANDPDKVRSILENDIECMSARHEGVFGMYEKGAAVSPAFGMVGTLVGLINMLKGMDLDGGGAGSLGKDMGTAMITTLYGCVLAHMIFTPISANLRIRDEEETLCKMIIVEGIMSIQSGENPKSLKEKLMTFVAQKQRDGGGEEGGKKGKKGK